ncbi:MAG: translocation/assembly module TamB domain-containing protein [Bryobacteraceae bacterium]|nr:translocation/assembly module TamB domain-containing protein [Bryobacteraceae bacterium]
MKVWLAGIGRLVTILLTFAFLLLLTALVVLRTGWFREQVRARIVQEVEKATGGKTSLGSFAFDPATLEVTVKEFVLRGKEREGEPPLARVEQIRAGFRITSIFRRSGHLALLEVSKPAIRIVTFPDGTNNIPGPKIKRDGKSVFELFVSIAARRFLMTDGFFEYDHQRLPLNLRAENLRIDFGWDAPRQRYQGVVAAQPFHFNWPKIAPLTFDSEVRLAMEKDGLVFEKAESRSGRSRITATGTLRDYRSPKVDLDVDGAFEMAEYVKPLRLPLSPEGTARFRGKFTYSERLLLTGTLSGQGLAVRQPSYAVAGVNLTSKVRVDSHSAVLTGIEGTALDGRFRGDARVSEWRDFEVKGRVDEVSLDQLRQVEKVTRPVAWSAMLSGPVELAGKLTAGGVSDLWIDTDIELRPNPGKIPLQGTLHARYEQRGGNLSFRPSIIETPHTRAEFSGQLRDRIRVRVDSADLNDFLPAAAMASASAPVSLPVQLDGGEARFDGVVISPIGGITLQGQANVTNLVYGKRKIERVSGDVNVTATGVSVANLRVQQGGVEAAGNVHVALEGWRAGDASAIGGTVTLARAPLEQILKEAGRDLPLKGDLTGSVQLAGTIANPSLDASVRLRRAIVAGEPFESIALDLKFQPGLIEARNGVARKAGSDIPFQAIFRHPADAFDRGKVEFQVNARDQSLASFEAVRRRKQGVSGRADVQASGILEIQPGRAVVDRLDSNIELRGLAIEGRPLGSLRLKAASEGQRLLVSASGDLAGSPWTGGGEWQLTGDSPGLGQIDFGTLSFAKLQELASVFRAGRPIPFEGQVTGTAVISGPIRRPEQLRAHVTLTGLEMRPVNDTKTLSVSVVQELTLRNDSPIVFDYGSKGLQVVQAKLTGKETNLELGGGIGTESASPWNLTLRGGLNLGLFQNYVTGLRTTGSAVVNATVRGSLENLLLGGRMEIKDASVYHRDFTNGIDKANGLVTFDRNRALLQNLTAQTGGGDLKMSGFVTFGTADTPMSYRLNTRAERVRVRWPEGASTTADGNLALTGTAARSLLSGTVTILRSGFTARTDIGAALLEPAKPVQTPTGNALLQGMQFDVRVNSAPNLQLETSLTSGLDATVDMRLRGSPLKPVVLGNVAVNQGEINFFGTRYNITRGTVSFFNAARIEPVLDLDLETTVRAVIVNMNVSGPMDKLNITYRSDPPLQTQDIIALLAVGRTPGSSTVAPQSNVASTGNGIYAGTETLLGQALSAGVSSRLNRFFGVSRVKIDPQLTGLESTPQARLTIEQQISRDITLTYVTNLTGALQQLVRLQWDISRTWSVTATRDENGVIGADILYRKRFK